MNALISVTVHTKHAFPEDKELLGVHAAVKELSARNAGKLVSRGQGMGHIDFAYEVDHPHFAKAKIALTLDKHVPGHQYTMNIKTLDTSMQLEGTTERRQLGDRRIAGDRRTQQALEKNIPQENMGLGM